MKLKILNYIFTVKFEKDTKKPSLVKDIPKDHQTILLNQEHHHHTASVREVVNIISEELFQISLVTYCVLLIIELIKENYVSYFFNMDILLVVVLISGIVMTTTTEDFQKKVTDTTWNYKYSVLLALGAAILVYYKTDDLRLLSLFIAIITGIITFLITLLIRHDQLDIH